jgi:hypothetical protein
MGEGPNFPAYPQTTLEEADYEMQQRKLEKKVALQNNRWRQIAKYAMLGASYLPLGIAGSTLDYVFGSRSTLAPVIDDCNAPDVNTTDWRPTPVQTETLEQVETEVSTVTSHAASFRPISRPENTANRDEDILLVPWNFRHEVTEFTMKSSGINIRVLTNRPKSNLKVDSEALEHAFNEPMQRWYVYTDESVRDFYFCAGRSLLINKDRAGTTIDISLPSKPNYCLNGVYAVAIGLDEEREGSCPTSGFDFPNLDLSLLNLVIEPHILFITGGRVDSMDASQRATRIFSHESAHEIMSLMDTRPLLNTDEQLAQLTADQLAVTRTEPLRPVFIYPS